MQPAALCLALFAAFTLIHSPRALSATELRIPAFTAYMLPDPESARISESRGVTQWIDTTQSVNWFGRFSQTGELMAKVQLRLPERSTSILRLTVDGTSRETTVIGAGQEEVITADFGTFTIAAAGHRRFQLESRNENGQPSGDIDALILDGSAIEGVHFNLKERRNAASVHLMYPVADGTEVEAFYCEVTAVEDPTTTFYMACGWHRGYFGMQINSPTERRIIFSVWDSGNEGIDRKKVADENRVRLLGKGEGVYSDDFGNEGTGGHSHLKYLWKTGEKQRFIVTAIPMDRTHTDYSGYWFHPEQQKWMLISSWHAPKEGGRLTGLHSFSENFGGHNGHLLRKALYGNQWIRTPDQHWTELTTARFSHDPTGREDRFDRFMGLANREFFLSHGGFRDGYTEYGTPFERTATKQPPEDLELPTVQKNNTPRVSTTDEACYPTECQLSESDDSSLSFQVLYSMSNEPHGEALSDQTNETPAQDTIALDMFLKLASVVPSGGAAKHLIQSGAVQVNGAVETRRGRKLRPGDLVEVHGEQFVIESDGL